LILPLLENHLTNAKIDNMFYWLSQIEKWRVIKNHLKDFKNSLKLKKNFNYLEYPHLFKKQTLLYFTDASAN